MENKDYLFVYDTSGIKNYIFGTSKLKEIRGASAILDILNRTKSVEIIRDIFPDIEIIYTNGGTGQFIFRNINDKKIELIIENLSNAYSKETFQGVQLICSYALLKSDNSDYKDALKECYFWLNHKKTKKFPKVVQGSLISKNCDTYNNSFSAITVKKIDQKQQYSYLSEHSNNKREANADHLWDEFMKESWSEIPKRERQDKRPESFKDLDNDIALIYADGNAMGKIIKSFTKPEDYKNFAKIVDSSIRQACYDTLKEIYPKSEHIKADILLLGGDDLVLVTRAYDAFDFAWKVAKKFNELTIQKLGDKAHDLLRKTDNKGFTISVGVSIGNANYPFRILLDQAEELLSLAKKKGSLQTKNEFYAPSYIDFHVNKQSNQLQIKQYREDNYELKKSENKIYRRSLRPFSLQDSEKFSNEIKQLQKNPDIGRTRIHMLREAINENSFSKIQLNFMHVYGRTKKKEGLKNILEAFSCMQNAPWNANDETIITDISDMIDLVGNSKNEA